VVVAPGLHHPCPDHQSGHGPYHGLPDPDLPSARKKVATSRYL